MTAALLYLAQLGATLALEVPLAGAVAPRGLRRRTMAAAVALNLCTHAAASAAAWFLGLDWFALEVAVVVLEAIGYRTLVTLSLARALGLSVCANLLSAAAAIALTLA